VRTRRLEFVLVVESLLVANLWFRVLGGSRVVLFATSPDTIVELSLVVVVITGLR